MSNASTSAAAPEDLYVPWRDLPSALVFPHTQDDAHAVLSYLLKFLSAPRTVPDQEGWFARLSSQPRFTQAMADNQPVKVAYWTAVLEAIGHGGSGSARPVGQPVNSGLELIVHPLISRAVADLTLAAFESPHTVYAWWDQGLPRLRSPDWTLTDLEEPGSDAAAQSRERAQRIQQDKATLEQEMARQALIMARLAIGQSAEPDGEGSRKRKRNPIVDGALERVGKVQFRDDDRALTEAEETTRQMEREFKQLESETGVASLKAIAREFTVPILVDDIQLILTGAYIDLENIRDYYPETVDNGGEWDAVLDGVRGALKKRTKAKPRPLTSSEWRYHFSTYLKFVVAVFPQRHAELTRYYAFISREFDVKDDLDYHTLVLQYDREARQEISKSGTNHVSLDDCHKLDDLWIRLVTVPYSVLSVESFQRKKAPKNSAGSSPRERERSDEACRRFNEGHCSQPESRCRYSHVCSACGAKGHAALKCPKVERAGGAGPSRA